MKILCCNALSTINDPIDEKCGHGIGYRHLQMILYFSLMMFSYCMRSVLSVAIVAMNDNTTTVNADIPVFQWRDQGVTLSSFFWGYAFLQIPAAYLGKKFGEKWLLTGSCMVDSTACLLIPMMAVQFGSKGVMICRLFQGFAQGFHLPSIHSLLGRWAPPCERSRIGTFTYTGSIFGYILCMPLTGLICSSHLGWPFSFYVWGSCGLFWCMLWTVFAANSPGCHKSIDIKEKEYIEQSLGHNGQKRPKIPWLDIFKSGPVWALIIANLGVNWGSSILLTQTPTYMNKILHYDIQSNALLSASPYLAMWIMSLIFSHICDLIINKQWITIGNARKLFHSIGTIGPALGLLGFSFLEDQINFSVVLFIIIGGSTAAGFCGFQVNHIDLSANHSGILVALSNGTTSIFSVLGPLMVHYVVTDQANQHQWRTIYLASAIIYVITDIFFVVFATGKVQPWNVTIQKEEIKDQATLSKSV